MNWLMDSDKWMNELRDRLIDGWIDWLIYELISGLMNGWINWLIYGEMDRRFVWIIYG